MKKSFSSDKFSKEPFKAHTKPVKKPESKDQYPSEPIPGVVYGRNAVTELLKSDRDVEKVYFLASVQKSQLTDFFKLAKERKIPMVMAMSDKFSKAGLSSQSHQGIFALVSPIRYTDLDSFLQTSGPGDSVAILDEIEDVHNLGAIIRSAEVFGFSAVILPLHHSAPLSAAAVKTSAGAVHHLPVIKVANLVQAIQKLKDHQFWVYGLDMGGDVWSDSARIHFPAAVVVGSEGKGIRPLVRKACDAVVGFPQKGKINSLNASVAAGIMFWEVSRRQPM